MYNNKEFQFGVRSAMLTGNNSSPQVCLEQINFGRNGHGEHSG